MNLVASNFKEMFGSKAAGTGEFSEDNTFF